MNAPALERSARLPAAADRGAHPRNLDARAERTLVGGIGAHILLGLGWLLLWRVSALMEYAPHASIWFPPAGLTFAAFLVLGVRALPVLFGCSVVATFWADAMYAGGQTAPALIEAGVYFGIAHCGSYWAGAATLRHLVLRRGHGQLPNLVIAFLLLGGIASLLAALLGAHALAAGGVVTTGEAWAIVLPWWIGDMAGVYILGPLFVGLLSWRYPEIERWLGGMAVASRSGGRGRFAGKAAVAALILGGTMGLAAALPHPEVAFAVFFLILPVMWIVYTESVFRTVVALAFLSVMMASLVAFLGLAGESMVYQFALIVVATSAWFGLAVPAVAEDNRQLREAQRALRESEERLQLVVRAVDDVIWEWEPANGRVEWSENARRMFGDDLGGARRTLESRTERIHPEDRDRVMAGLERLVEGENASWSAEYRILGADGEYATVLDRAHLHRDALGAPLRVVGSMMDVTERRRSEDAQRFLAGASALLDRSLDPRVVLPDLARLVVPGYADLCRIDLIDEEDGARCAASANSEEAPGSAFAELRPLDDGSDLRRAVPGEGALVLPDTSEAGDGWGAAGELAVRAGLSALLVVPLVAQGRTIGAITLAMAGSGRRYGEPEVRLAEDLARRTAARLENARLYALAQRAIRAREEVLGVVSHDLRNPLGTVTLAADVLADPGRKLSDDDRSWIASIVTATSQMDRLIHDLIDAARIDAGGFSVDPSLNDAGALLRELVAVFAPHAERNGIALETSVPEGLPPIRVDAAQVLRVLSNLVGNALKFTPSGGNVRVEAAVEGEEVRFSVADSGPGIPADAIPHIFDRFWQGEKGDRRGVGLGLAIAEGIVRTHGGRIWADSLPGEGATFHFTVPLAADR